MGRVRVTDPIILLGEGLRFAVIADGWMKNPPNPPRRKRGERSFLCRADGVSGYVDGSAGWGFERISKMIDEEWEVEDDATNPRNDQSPARD